MNNSLFLSLLCVALAFSAAQAVPVEAAAQEEVAISVPAEDVLEEVTENEQPLPDLEAVKTAGEDALSLQSNGQPPAPAVQGASCSKSNCNSRCRRGWHQYQDNCFMFMNVSYSWTNADFFCESLGASMASAHDLQEYTFLKQLTWREGFVSAWMGGYRFQGFWKWDDGTPFDYQNWDENQSYNDCVFLNSQGSKGWTGSSCTSLHPFICSTRLNTC